MSYNKLDSEAKKRQFALNCVARRRAFEAWTNLRKLSPQKDILIVADRPGPKAPQTDNFHHTPFYSKIHSGGWLNCLLLEATIAEDRLFWTNSATWDGKPGDVEILTATSWKHIVALGGNAAKFLQQNNVSFARFDHPQYHKRFVGDEYPLIPWLQLILSKSLDE